MDELGLAGVRHHGLLDDDMGVVLGWHEYNFTLIEQSWDAQVVRGVVPIVELSFMPAILANCTWKSPAQNVTVNPEGDHECTTGMQYKAVVEHPLHFEDWHHLVTALVEHAVQRYGVGEVRRWHFEVWNEMWGMDFPHPYMELYNASAWAIKGVDPSFSVGGPATMQLLHVKDFVDEARAMGAPFDFVSSHMYPTDPQCECRRLASLTWSWSNLARFAITRPHGRRVGAGLLTQRRARSPQERGGRERVVLPD